MATPTSEEIQEIYQEETEYTTHDDTLAEAYTQAVEDGNAEDTDDDDDDNDAGDTDRTDDDDSDD